MHGLTRYLRRTATGLLLALSAGLLAAPAQAQNSREATEAVRKHRAESGHNQRPAPAPAPAPVTGAPAGKRDTTRPFSSSADPTANPKLSLKSCMDHAGLSITGRDACFRQHCQGRWGEGECPPGSDTSLIGGGKSKPSHTPLGRCLADAGANPIKRTKCGWAHCKPDWSSAECKALAPPPAPRSN